MSVYLFFMIVIIFFAIILCEEGNGGVGWLLFLPLFLFFLFEISARGLALSKGNEHSPRTCTHTCEYMHSQYKYTYKCF